jgi:hypothetical protein
MNSPRDKSLKSNKFSKRKKSNVLEKNLSNTPFKFPLCQWCKSSEIKLVPVSSLRNLKVGEMSRYLQIWQRQGWPTKFYLCRICRQNCELARQRLNLWLCPGCRKCLVYSLESRLETTMYNQLPSNCSRCGWKKKHLTKKQQQKITNQVIKSGLSYQKIKENSQKNYFACCSFCKGEVVGKQKDKEVLARNKVGFWTEKESEERIICGGCLRDKQVVKELGIKGIKRQMLYNYRRRGLV